jgi:DNA-binding transcriptional MocR family regulator
MITLSPVQSRLYSWLCDNLSPGEMLPTLTEIARAVNISHGSVTYGLASLAKSGLIRGERSTYCEMWVYTMLICNASYTIRRRSSDFDDSLDPWELARVMEL